MTFRATAGGLDAATMAAADARYLKLAADNDPLTGTLATQALQPDVDVTRDIGTALLRYQTVHAARAQFLQKSGGGPHTLTVTDGNAFVGIQNNGSGSVSVTCDAATNGGSSFLAASAMKPTGAGTITMNANGKGSASFMSAIASAPYVGYGTAVVSITNTGFGGVLFGAVDTYYGNIGGTISHSATGGFTNATLLGGGTATNTSSGGFLNAVIGGGGGTATVSATAAFVSGFAFGGGAVEATANAATAIGVSRNSGEVVRASATGSLAQGDTNAVASIIASGVNSQQFGPGTNSQASSLSVGTQMRLKGTTGAPTTPRNGDLWVGTTDVNIRTVGVNLTLNRPTVTGSRATGAALTDLLAKLSTMNLILDSTTA